MNAIRTSKRKTKKKRKKKSAAQKYYERKKSDREEAISILSSGAQDVTAKRDVGSGKIFSDHSAHIRYSHGKKYLVASTPIYDYPKERTAGLYDYVTIKSENGVEMSHKLNQYGEEVPELFKLFIGSKVGKVVSYLGHNFELVKIRDEVEYRADVHENMAKIDKGKDMESVLGFKYNESDYYRNKKELLSRKQEEKINFDVSHIFVSEGYAPEVCVFCRGELKKNEIYIKGIKKNGESEQKRISFLKCTHCGKGYIGSTIYSMLLTVYKKNKFNVEFKRM